MSHVVDINNDARHNPIDDVYIDDDNRSDYRLLLG
jgi:hypothetical protein